ncbi:MAG: oxidoreductase [Ponticaulis sp.]|nr:oxidoreductase [Ponticaulis sp.]
MIEPKIAIVGSGPSGCFAAQFLRKSLPDAEITIFETLPVPYGLARFGVAADHQGSKSVCAQFDRMFERDGVQFAGNVTVGDDISFSDLRSLFDIVIVASGLRNDRRLELQKDKDMNIVGAGEIVRALNGFPEIDLPKDTSGNLAPLGQKLAVVGNGNVAIDVIRMLTRPIRGFDGSDVDDARLLALRGNGIRSIDVLGRSPIEHAKFDTSMLREISHLPNVKMSCTGTEGSTDCKALDIFREHSGASEPDVEIRFHFKRVPSAFLKNGDTSILFTEAPDGAEHFEVDTLVTAIGFFDGLPSGHPRSGHSWVGPNVFRVGWAENGGQGTIAANRKSSKTVAQDIVDALTNGKLQIGAAGYHGARHRIQSDIISFDGWKRIDEAERANRAEGRLRNKITDTSEMIKIALGQVQSSLTKCA